MSCPQGFDNAESATLKLSPHFVHWVVRKVRVVVGGPTARQKGTHRQWFLGRDGALLDGTCQVARSQESPIAGSTAGR